MDPYLLNSAGYSAEDDPALMLPPLAKQQALSANVRPQPRPQQTRLTSIPTQGVAAPQPQQDYQQPAAPAAPAAAPAAARPDYRQMALDRAQQANEAATTMPDMSGQVQRYRQGYEAAGPDMAIGMLMQQLGGAAGRESGGQVFKQALANRQKQTTPFGTLDYEGGFTSDPMKEREFKINRLEKQAQLYENMATHAETAEERTRAHLASEALLREAQAARKEQAAFQRASLGEAAALRRQQFEQGKWVKLKNEAGDEYLLNTTSGETKGGGAQGGAGPGGERLPKLNDSQGKAVAFGMRAAEAAQQLESLGTSYSSASVAAKGGLERLPHVGGLLGSAYNVAMGPQEQQAEQAQRNFINAILRRESGAVINPEEFSNARQQYFPQPGDSDEVLAQKKQNRDTSIRGLQIEAGPGARFVTEKLNAGKQTKPITRPGALPQTNLKNRVNSYYD